MVFRSEGEYACVLDTLNGMKMVKPHHLGRRRGSSRLYPRRLGLGRRSTIVASLGSNDDRCCGSRRRRREKCWIAR